MDSLLSDLESESELDSESDDFLGAESEDDSDARASALERSSPSSPMMAMGVPTGIPFAPSFSCECQRDCSPSLFSPVPFTDYTPAIRHNPPLHRAMPLECCKVAAPTHNNFGQNPIILSFHINSRFIRFNLNQNISRRKCISFFQFPTRNSTFGHGR